MIMMQGRYALLHVISLVDWPKHVDFFLFLFYVGSICNWAAKTNAAKVTSATHVRLSALMHTHQLPLSVCVHNHSTSMF